MKQILLTSELPETKLVEAKNGDIESLLCRLYDNGNYITNGQCSTGFVDGEPTTVRINKYSVVLRCDCEYLLTGFWNDVILDRLFGVTTLSPSQEGFFLDEDDGRVISMAVIDNTAAINFFDIV